MTEGQNGTADRSEGSDTQMSASPSAFISIDLPIKCGQLLGPFSDPFQWLALKYTETSDADAIERRALELFRNIEIARHSEEKNLEIVLRNGNFYFKALKDISHVNTKLFAWFCDDLNSRLPMPASTTVNGSKRYYCGLCNQVFLYPNLVVIHVLFNCSKRLEIAPSNFAQTASANRQIVSQMPNSQSKKRSFDIASLVNDDKDTKRLNKNGFEQSNSTKSAFQAPISTSVVTDETRMASSSITTMASPLLSSLSPISVASLAQHNNHIPSAFRKVDKANTLSSSDSGENCNYSFANFFGNSRGIGVPPVFPTHGTYPSSLGNSLLSPTTPSLPTSSAAIASASNASSKNLPIPPSLLPYLPPSLAALSFPQTNWCAKCNATFRMTSDLVYHMRSHHKNLGQGDPLKKKREEKLRCTICGESFRERHHLTRHMTSHQ
ncbi:uncharacterized protein B4U79_15978 [Dinothrombium tinctorium]|uniref:C2H2-type domain-containing protein n=1 Tax=Dinothrombium tinctorium TaxID=1965070 RepID=A0A3S3Q278_9ACAR|nr:uncharacterized protein B4U79_08159 [Dinothrombium tinctorium]RWS12510.1 uncharacterized protein B4U79_15978 [Dinothrombium tinctorium]